MADGKVLLEVVVEGKNVKVVQREVEQVTTAVNENTRAQERNSKANRQSASSQQENTKSAKQNASATQGAADAAGKAAGEHAHYDRALKGVHQSNLSGSKGFSKMRDAIDGGSSGLVAAYATLAANMFAATAAFTALQKASQVEQLTQGLVSLGRASGIAMMSLSKGLQDSTGYAISLQDSMKSVTMVTSAGFDPSTIERLGKVAKNTSIALGRDLQDSLNRVVKGATKLEPELLDELGIMVRIDEASQMYAQSLGKNASQLTNFEKRQAFMNAVLAEGEKKFGAIGDSVGANPYDRLSASLQELSTIVLNVFSTILAPIAEFLSKSKILLASFILSFSKGLVGSALPILGQMAQKTSLVAQKNAQLAIQEDKITQQRIANSKQTISQINTEQRAFGNAAINRAKIATTEAQRTASITELKSKAALATKKAMELETAAAATGIADPKVAMYRERAALLGLIITELETINTLENRSLTTVPKAVAASTKGSYYQATSERFSSVQENRSFSNYRAQWAGMSEDSKKFKTEVKAMNGQFTALGRGLTSVAGSLGAYAASTQAAGAGTSYLGRAAEFLKGKLLASALSADVAGAAVLTFAERVKFAGLAMFEFMGVIGLVVMAATLLYQGISWLYKQFQSDASKKYEKNLEDANQKTIELNNASEELNLSLKGKSSTIVTLSQQIDSQTNIVNQASDSYYKLRDSAALANESYEDTIAIVSSQINSNKFLQTELSKTTGGYTNLDKFIKDNNLTQEQALEVIDKLFDSSKKYTNAQQNLSKSVKEAGRAFVDYYNSFKNTTQYSTYIGKLEDVSRAFNDVKNQAGRGENFKAIAARLSDMDPLEVQALGKEFSALRDGVMETDNEIRKLTGQLDTLSTYKVTNFNPFEQGLKAFKNFVVMPNMKEQFNALKTGYSALFGDIAKSRKEINNILASTGQETISIFTTQSQYEERSKAAQIVLEARRKGWIADGEKISKKTQEILDKELQIVLNLERRAAAVEQEKNNLERLNKLQEIYGYETKSNFIDRESSQANLYTKEIALIDDQIHNTQRLMDMQAADSSSRLQFESKLNELQNKRAIAEAEQISYKYRESKRAAELSLKNYQYEADHQLEVLKILEERQKFASQELDTRKKSAELDAQIQNLKAGGTGELSIAQQEKIFNDQLAARKEAIDNEYSIKLRIFEIEQTINRGKMMVLAYEIEAKQKEMRDRAAEARSKATRLNNRASSFFVSAERSASLSKQANELNSQAKTSEDVANRLGSTLGELFSIINDTEIVDKMRDLLGVERDVQKKNIEIENLKYKNNLDSKQIAVDIAQAYSDAGSKLNDIVTKMIDARTSIIDSEQTILENQMKADNRKKTGKGELSAKQESDIQKKFLQKRLDIIEAEKKAKIDMINLEYDLLDAKTRFEQLRLTSEIQAMKDRVPKPKKGEDVRDYLIQIKNITDLETSLKNTLSEILNKIPGARGLATQAATTGAEAAASTQRENTAAADERAKRERLKDIADYREAEIALLKVRLDFEEKLSGIRMSILDDEKTAAENKLKIENLRNKGINKAELTTAQSADLEIKYQEQRKALIQEEYDRKKEIIGLETELLRAQLELQRIDLKERLSSGVQAAIDQGNTADASRLQKVLDTVDPTINRILDRTGELTSRTLQQAGANYSAQMSEATLAQVEAFEAAYGWMDNNTTSWKDIATAIGDTFANTLQQSKEISIELAGIFTNALDSAADAFVDAIVEGKNVLEGIKDATRNSLREGLAGLAKTKIKEGIAGIGSGLLGKITGSIPGMGGSKLGADFSKMLQGPQERVAGAAESTVTGIGESNRLLTQIEINTRGTVSGAVGGASGPTFEPGGFSGKAPKVNLDKKPIQLLDQNASNSERGAIEAKQTAENVGFWGKAQTYATENVGTIAAAGFASMAAALAAGASTKQTLLSGVLGAVGMAVAGAFTGGNPMAIQAVGQMTSMAGGKFASGGVMTSSGPMPLEKYAKGGIAREPQLALYGEGRKPEAYVPLPDGRSIPVSMSGGGGNVNNVSVNVSVTGGQAQTQTSSAGGKDQSEEQARMLGAVISNAVKQEMLNQQRPGGLLYKGRR